MTLNNGTIVLVGGGTGGHFFPAVATAQAIEASKLSYVPHLITDNRCSKFTKDISMAVEVLNIARPKRTFIGIIKFITSNIKAIYYCLWLFRKHKAKLVIGFGGYPSFAPLVAAFFARIPIALHEQNSFLGAVNKLFLKRARFLALSFKETMNVDKKYLDKTVLVGNPIRSNISSRQTLQLRKQEGEFILFVTGGSQAAKMFTEIVPESLKIVLPKLGDIKLKIYHQAPKDDIAILQAAYHMLGIEHVVTDFFYNIGEIYAQADLCICRAGASTVAELQSNKLPAILVPYPYASHDHQTYNAKIIEALGAGWCITQSQMNSQLLAETLVGLFKHSERLKDASDAYPQQVTLPSNAMVQLIQKTLA